MKVMKPNEIDHHCSDLYLKVTEESDKLIENYEFRGLVTTFKSIRPDDKGSLWYDIPFGYIPEWQREKKD